MKRIKFTKKSAEINFNITHVRPPFVTLTIQLATTVRP
jgi:hypothetical protein